MFDRLIDVLTGQTEADPAETENAGRTAMAAILVEAARADDVYLAAEKDTIDRILMQRYGLDATAAARLRGDGEAAQSDSVDIVRFTRAIKDAVPYEDRVSVIEAVWRVVYADDDRDAEESALVRQLAGLLYVPDREVGLARQRVVGA
jgi:uncharacterized tellurite resistance protein B-like protein